MTKPMTSAEAGQVTAQAARIYDAFFVPALFGQFAPSMVQAAGVGPGQQVLDNACGTGTAALAALPLVRPGGRVAAADINPGMLAAAAEKSDAINWTEAPAELLPFETGTFDAATCQFALMFFADRVAALAEALRVLRPGGRLAVATFRPVADSPGYRDLIPLIGEIAGPEAADALKAPFCLGDKTALRGLLEGVGFEAVDIRGMDGTARFTSLDDWLHTEIGGWTLAEFFTPEMLEDLIARARTRLAGYVTADGSVPFPAPALVGVGRKPA